MSNYQFNPFTKKLDIAGISSLGAGSGITIDNTDPNNPIISSNGTNITVVSNYSALPAPSTATGKFYWVSNSQGTAWLPGSLGGTYYNSGLYYSNGTTWEFLNVPYQATQADVNAGTDNLKFVTSVTLFNSTQWNTKQNALSGTGFVKITGTTISYDTNTYLTTTAASAAYLPINNPIYTGVLATGTLSYADTGILASFQGSINSYNQNIIQNTNAGATASSDLVVNNNLSTATTYYGDLGMNSSGFTGTGSFSLPNAIYLSATSADLVLGTTTSNVIRFVINNGTLDALVIGTSGAITIGVWNGSVISPTYGGTGINNGANTITVGGNFTTIGAFNATIAVPRTTTWTLPNTASETLAGLATAQSFSALQTFTANIAFSSGGNIMDSAGVQLINFPSTVTSAVNYLQISNSATTVSPSITAVGSDTSINISLIPKGTGGVQVPIGGGSTTPGLYFANSRTTGFSSGSGGSFNMTAGGTNIITINSSGLNMLDKDIIFTTATGTKLGGTALQKFAVWGATPIVQPSGANQAAVSDGSGGTASFALVGAGTLYTAANINNNFAALARQVNEMRNVLTNIGLMKGSV